MQSGTNFGALPNSVMPLPSDDPCCAILSRVPVMMRLPDGQITTSPSKPLSSPQNENISLFQKCKSGVGKAVSCPQEGRIAIVTDVGCGMRWTRRCARRAHIVADGQVAWSRSPDAGINPWASSRARGGRWLSSPAHQGEREAAVNTIARGMPACFGQPAVTNSRDYHFTREAAGAACTRHSLRPLYAEGHI